MLIVTLHSGTERPSDNWPALAPDPLEKPMLPGPLSSCLRSNGVRSRTKRLGRSPPAAFVFGQGVFDFPVIVLRRGRAPPAPRVWPPAWRVWSRSGQSWRMSADQERRADRRRLVLRCACWPWRAPNLAMYSPQVSAGKIGYLDSFLQAAALIPPPKGEESARSAGVGSALTESSVATRPRSAIASARPPSPKTGRDAVAPTCASIKDSSPAGL